ncbi:unnamed protein product [Oncorhynchus mykiss]|uniref:Uncharacterized protein n=1 Tax=Oncorhynchus mykiss TaxID=8022 RepID=A0A060Z7R2_ONCMY|nr:unnamed protein product [Oncorhynchus mykiss]
MVQVKAEHFRALAHYNAAVALCDHTQSIEEGSDEESAKALFQFHVSSPAGPPLSQVLRDPEDRRKLGKAHLRCAVIRHEEAMRVHGLCKILRKMDILQEVLSFMYKRSLDKYSEMDREDDFDETADAPEIHSQTQHKPDITPPNFSTVPVTDIFQRLEAGLREGDYIVAVDGEDFKWAKHGEVVHILKSCSDRGIQLSIITLHTHDTQVDRRQVMLSPSGDEANALQRTMGRAKGQRTAPLLNWNRKKTGGGGRATKRLGSTFSLPFGNLRDCESMY